MSVELQNVAQLLNVLQAVPLNEEKTEYYSKEADVYLFEAGNVFDTATVSYTVLTKFNRGLSVEDLFVRQTPTIVSEPYKIPYTLLEIVRQMGFRPIMVEYTTANPAILLQIARLDDNSWLYLQLGDSYIPFKILESGVSDQYKIQNAGLEAILSGDNLSISIGDKTENLTVGQIPQVVHRYLHIAEILRILKTSRYASKLRITSVETESPTLEFDEYYLLSPEYLQLLPINGINYMVIGNVFVDGKKLLSILNKLGLIQVTNGITFNLPISEWPISFVVKHNTGIWNMAKAYIKLNTTIDDLNGWTICNKDKLIDLEVIQPPLMPPHEQKLEFKDAGVAFKATQTWNNLFVELNGTSYKIDNTDMLKAYKQILKFAVRDFYTQVSY